MRYIPGLLLAASTLLGSQAYAAASCDLKHFAFGNNSQSIASQYSLDMPNMDPGADHEVISRTPNSVCAELPAGISFHFVFVDDKLVEVQIENPKNDGTLQALADQNFGASDNKPNKSTGATTGYHQVWDTDPNFLALYTLHPDTGKDAGKMVEYIDITSKMYRQLMEQQNSDDAKEN